MPAESPDNTLVLSPTDPPLGDMFGNAYGLTGTGRVSINGTDAGAPPTQMLAYVGRTVWLQDLNGNWRSRRHPTDPWGPPAPIPPLPNDRLASIHKLLNEVLTNQQTMLANDELILGAVGAAGQAGGTLATILAAIQAMEAVLQQILAAVTSNQPSKIKLDTAAATVASQPVPTKPGP